MKIKKESIRKLALLVAASTILAVWVLNRMNSPIRLEEFRTVKVGQFVPGFGAWTEENNIDIEVSSEDGTVKIDNKISTAKFYFHFTNHHLPAMCIDLECGPEAKAIVSKGGHLIGTADGKGASQYGLEITAEPYTFDESLMVVADASSRITAIYKNAYLSDVKDILEDLNL